MHSLQNHPVSDHYEYDDLTLWKEFTLGHMPSYELIYNRYINELFQYCFLIVSDRSNAEDIIHDLFADLWSSREKLGEVRSVRLYLFSCIKRRAFRKLKRSRKMTFFDDGGNKNIFEIVPSFLEEKIKKDDKGSLGKKLKNYISALSKRQREIIYLRFYQNMSYPEIAELLELDQKYTYNLASKAFCSLRKIIPKNTLVSFYFYLILL